MFYFTEHTFQSSLQSLYPVQDILCSLDYQTDSAIQSWVSKYTHQWIPSTIDLQWVLKETHQVNTLILPFSQILPLPQSEVRIRYLWTRLPIQQRSNLLTFLERDQLHIAHEYSTAEEIEVFCIPRIERIPFPKHIDPQRVQRLFEFDLFSKGELFEQNWFKEHESVDHQSVEEERHDPLGIFSDKQEKPIVCKMTNPFLPCNSLSKDLPPAPRHDPLGLFTAEEKPIICKMTNPFLPVTSSSQRTSL